MSGGKGIVLSKAWITEGPDGPRIRKAEEASQQLAEDPFAYSGGAEGGLVRPLYDMDALVAQQERNSLHARCVTQKSEDVLGRGIELRANVDEAKGQVAAAQEEDRWGEFVRSIEDDDRGDGSLKERLTWAHQDYEGVGWAVLEVGRRADGTLDGVWYVPGHTVRAHIDGKRFAQKVGGKSVWFKRFGIDGTVDPKSGGWSDRTVSTDNGAGHELIVIRNHTPRSRYYGLPDHIPAMSAIAGWTAQAEYNVRFFGNHAVPSYAVVIEGAELTPDLEATILDHFRQIKGDPARTIIIPIPGIPGNEAAAPKLRFERLSVEVKEASFRLYKQDNALEICIAHGVPPYRVGWPILGSLGGATAEEMTAIYLDSIVQPRQETWEQRLDRSFLGAKGLAIVDWRLKCAELDTRNEQRDLEMARLRYELGIATPAEIARFFGGNRTDPDGERYIAVPLAPQAGLTAPAPSDAVAKAATWMAEVRALSDLRERVTKAVGIQPAMPAPAADPVELHVHNYQGSYAIHTPAVTVEAPPAPDVHVKADIVLEKGSVEVLSPITVEPARVEITKGAIQVDAPVTIHNPAPAPAPAAAPRTVRKRVERDTRGVITGVVEEQVTA